MNNDYQAYLIRFRRCPEANTWRATLENAHSREVIQFATEKELLLFLLQRLSGWQENRSDTNQAMG
ncbi:MAG: hypothetical protein KC423_24935 [Anaerolineales bacterium]|nr:hypothetical protein [Anaerolineales bacterium]MCA9999836.1 hypothetical protein [Anaerolineales bacterium]